MYLGHKHVESGPNCSHELSTFLKPLKSNKVSLSPHFTELLLYLRAGDT